MFQRILFVVSLVLGLVFAVATIRYQDGNLARNYFEFGTSVGFAGFVIPFTVVTWMKAATSKSEMPQWRALYAICALLLSAATVLSILFVYLTVLKL